MALWKWFLQTITKTPPHQEGVGKYVYLHPWALWSFGLSWRKFCPDARFCGARLLVSGRLAVGVGNFVMMRVFVVAWVYFASLLAWRCGNGFRKQLRKRHRLTMV